MEELKNSPSQEKLKRFIETDDLSQINKEKPLFKRLIMNLLNQTNTNDNENTELDAIYAILNHFNQFLISGKKLELGAFRPRIRLSNGQTHFLNELSSGEQHLLTFLTLFLVLRRNDNVFFIDEPEISLSMAWQRKLLPLLSEFAPQAQIIVATHSPEIADGNIDYLRKIS